MLHISGANSQTTSGLLNLSALLNPVIFFSSLFFPHPTASFLKPHKRLLLTPQRQLNFCTVISFCTSSSLHVCLYRQKPVSYIAFTIKYSCSCWKGGAFPRQDTMNFFLHSCSLEKLCVVSVLTLHRVKSPLAKSETDQATSPDNRKFENCCSKKV